MDYEQILNNIACSNNLLLNLETIPSFYNFTTNKKEALKFLKNNNFPTTKQIDVSDKSLNPEMTVIVKPNDQCCGNGIIVDKLKKIRKMSIPNDYIVESYLNGINYRIILYRGKIISIIERHFPEVVGDGIHTVKELIDIENPKRTIKNKLVHQLKPYMLKRIPKKGQVIRVAKMSNYCKGGRILEYLINKVHQDNLKMFERLANITQFNIFAIDYITKDITKSYLDKNNENGINELENNGHAVHYSINDKFTEYSKIFLSRTFIIIVFIIICLYYLF